VLSWSLSPTRRPTRTAGGIGAPAAGPRCRPAWRADPVASWVREKLTPDLPPPGTPSLRGTVVPTVSGLMKQLPPLPWRLGRAPSTTRRPTCGPPPPKTAGCELLGWPLPVRLCWPASPGGHNSPREIASPELRETPWASKRSRAVRSCLSGRPGAAAGAGATLPYQVGRASWAAPVERTCPGFCAGGEEIGPTTRHPLRKIACVIGTSASASPAPSSVPGSVPAEPASAGVLADQRAPVSPPSGPTRPGRRFRDSAADGPRLHGGPGTP